MITSQDSVETLVGSLRALDVLHSEVFVERHGEQPSVGTLAATVNDLLVLFCVEVELRRLDKEHSNRNDLTDLPAFDRDVALRDELDDCARKFHALGQQVQRRLVVVIDGHLVVYGLYRSLQFVNYRHGFKVLFIMLRSQTCLL